MNFLCSFEDNSNQTLDQGEFLDIDQDIDAQIFLVDEKDMQLVVTSTIQPKVQQEVMSNFPNLDLEVQANLIQPLGAQDDLDEFPILGADIQLWWRIHQKASLMIYLKLMMNMYM